MTADHPASSDDLVARLRARASDPDRRIDVRQDAFSAQVTSLDLGSLIGMLGGAAADLKRIASANQAGRVELDLVAKADRIGEAMSTPVPTTRPLPLDAAALARAEAELGFALPPMLRRVYLEVGNGGFGPGGGLLSVADAVAAYARLRTGVELPRGRTWPDGLVPVIQADPGYDCVDTSTEAGRVVTWDPDGLGEHSGEKAWNRSFSEVASSIEAWLSEWVGGRTQAEKHADIIRQARIDSVRQSRAYFAAMTPEQRAEYGLPEVGWEKQIGGHLGLDDELD